jgi:D-sedoheptulose 7-phosphate isomerase
MTRRSATRLADHLDNLTAALPELRRDCTRLNRWGTVLAARLTAGHRLLVAGNGGSAAEAQHLTAELVGRFDRDRRPLSAIALHAETSSVTAISNDYGYDQVYARQVRAHARPRDILLLLTTSGTSPNLLSATTAATELGVDTWAMTGPAPNPLATRCDEALCLPGPAATTQEGHLIAIHLLCIAIEAALPGHTELNANGSTDRETDRARVAS